MNCPNCNHDLEEHSVNEYGCEHEENHLYCACLLTRQLVFIADHVKLRAENEKLRAVLNALLRAYEADAKTRDEIYMQICANARAALKESE